MLNLIHSAIIVLALVYTRKINEYCIAKRIIKTKIDLLPSSIADLHEKLLNPVGSAVACPCRMRNGGLYSHEFVSRSGRKLSS